MYLSGDRREVDRLILYSINRVTAVVIDHVRKEEERNDRIDGIGGFDAITTRAEFVDSLIKRNNRMSAMMEKVAASSISWAVIAFAGFLAFALWESIKVAARRG